MRQDRLQRVVRPPRPARSLPHTAVLATPVLNSGPIAEIKMAISINIWPVMQYCLPHTSVLATPVLSSGLVMSTISKRKQKRSDIEAYYWNESKTF
jgi:hypothetical protein